MKFASRRAPRLFGMRQSRKSKRSTLAERRLRLESLEARNLLSGTPNDVDVGDAWHPSQQTLFAPNLLLGPSGGDLNHPRFRPSNVTPALIAVGEAEPNNQLSTANAVPLGFDAGEDTEVDVNGTIAPAPTPTTVTTSEENGSLGTATVTGLTAGSLVTISSTIGDGTFGSTNGDFDWYSIIGVTANEIITVDVNTSASGLDSMAVIYNADGDVLTVNDDSARSTDSFLAFTAPEDGNYFVVISSIHSGIQSDPNDPSTGRGLGPSGNTGDYTVTIGRDASDLDFFEVELNAGDIFGANVSGAGRHLSLINNVGQELQGSVNGFSTGPLPGGGNAAVGQVITTPGRYFVRVLGTPGSYDLNLRVFRPVLENEVEGTRQILFLDFDGEALDGSTFGVSGTRTLSPLSDFLPNWGLTAADEDAVIDAIIASVTENLQTDIRANGNNGDFSTSGTPGEFDIEIRNSRDDADPFGEDHVSRVIIGGTIAELGIGTIGIAESVDVGNFDTTESGAVLLDLLSAPATNANSLNQYGIDPSASIIDLIGVGVGNIASHEAAHFFAAWHTDQSNDVPRLIDQGGNLDNTIGIGADRIFGTSDDIDIDFGTDTYVPNEDFTGIQDTLNSLAFGLSTGTVASATLGQFTGVVYTDANRNGTQDVGETGRPGEQVFIDANGNGLLDTGEDSTTTAGDGSYTLSVEPDTHRIVVVPRSGFDITEPDSSGVYTQAVTGGATVADLDFGFAAVSPSGGGGSGGSSGGSTTTVTEIVESRISGTKYNDLNGDGERQDNEPGIPDHIIYLDENNDGILGIGEQAVRTDADGNYSFDFEFTLEVDTTPTELDVFLLFDDTGSFAGEVPALQTAFPTIVSNLESALPDVDLAFGIGRFEEYGDFELEDVQGRPFILNQPIIRSASSGFDTAIDAALAREAPGFGGDLPETVIEGLLQTATGVGFDGDGDGNLLESGAAGLVSTQTMPGDSGDVPPFSSFTADPSGPVLSPAGSIGGAGFRENAFRIVLVATDVGFVFEPDGLTEYTGIDGVTVDASQVQVGGRDTTPGNRGAGIQATIDALVAAGIRVVGLGTDSDSTSAPRAPLEALATLTGATNQGETNIDGGISEDPIAPGDPLYFLVDISVADDVANGIVQGVLGAFGDVEPPDPVEIILREELPPGFEQSFPGGDGSQLVVVVPGEDVTGVDFGNHAQNDFGDAPAAYGTLLADDGATHGVVPTFRLGRFIDSEGDGNPSETAQGDDENTSIDDEDGVVFASGLEFGTTATIQVLASVDVGFLQGWIDLNGDRDWDDPGEQIIRDVRLSAGVNTLQFELPEATADSPSETFARFRYGVERGISHNGPALLGEVEDYAVSFPLEPQSAIIAEDDEATVVEDSADNPIVVLDNDRTLFGDSLSVESVASPTQQGGAVSVSSDRQTILYTPAEDFSGTDTFEYTVVDNVGSRTTATVTVMVTNVQDAPNAEDDSFEIRQNLFLEVAAPGVLENDTDVDRDTLTASVVQGPQFGTLELQADGSFVYIPDFEVVVEGTLEDSFTYQASDQVSDGNTDTATVTITILPPNGPRARNDQETVLEDTRDHVFDVTANDVLGPQGGTITLMSLDTTGLSGMAAITDGQVSYTPGDDFTGTETFRYTIIDNMGGESTALVTVTVVNLNDNPTAVNDQLSVTENSSSNELNVLANDSFAPDPDETLSILSVGATSAGGTAIRSGLNQSVLYTPPRDFVGTDQFTYTVTDGNGGTDTALVTVEVEPTEKFVEFSLRTVDSSGQEIDEILVGETFTLQVFAEDLRGVPVGNDSRGIVQGYLDVLYDSSLVTLTGSGVVHGPSYGTQRAAAINNDTATPPVLNEIGSSLVDLGAPLGLGEHLLLSVEYIATASGVFEFTSNAADEFLNTIVLAGQASAVNPINVTFGSSSLSVFEFTVGSDQFATDEGTPILQAAPGVLANDNDPAGNPLTVSAVNGVAANVGNEITLSSGATLTLNANGSFDYDPSSSSLLNALDENEQFVDTFQYTASNNLGSSSVGVVSITIAGLNDAPTINGGAFFVQDSAGQNDLVGTVVANDPESDPLTFTIVSGNPGAAPNQLFSINPTNGAITVNNPQLLVADEVHQLTVAATDSGTTPLTNTATIQITVTENGAPVATPNDYATDEATAQFGNLITDNTGDGVDQDPDGDALVVSAVNGVAGNVNSSILLASGATLLVSANGGFEYDPTTSSQLNALAAGETFTETFEYTIRDTPGGTSTATVRVMVTGVNDSPTATNDLFNTDEDSALAGNLVTLDNGNGIDSDPDTTNALMIDAINGNSVAVGVPIVLNSNATLTLTSLTGGFIYDPTTSSTLNALGLGEQLVDSFAYTISDGNGGQDTATVLFTVQGVNDAPTASDNNYRIRDSELFSGNLVTDDTGAGSDSDVEGDSLEVSEVNGNSANVGVPVMLASNAILTVQDDGTFTYDPTGVTDFINGQHLETFEYTVSDGQGGVDTATVTITVDEFPGLVAFRLQVVDENGAPIDEIEVGRMFDLQVFVQDLRLPEAGESRGVHQAFLDILYDSNLVALTEEGVQHGPLYGSLNGSLVNNQTDTAGLLNEVGSSQEDLTSPPGSQEVLLFSIEFMSTAPGSFDFTSESADEPLNTIVVAGPLQIENLEGDINFSSTSLEIVSNAVTNPLNQFDVNADGQVNQLDTEALVAAITGDTPPSTPAPTAFALSSLSTPQFVDVNGDSILTTVDLHNLVFEVHRRSLLASSDLRAPSGNETNEQTLPDGLALLLASQAFEPDSSQGDPQSAVQAVFAELDDTSLPTDPALELLAATLPEPTGSSGASGSEQLQGEEIDDILDVLADELTIAFGQ